MTDSRPSLSTRERARLFNLHGGKCHICGQKIDGTKERWDVEHIIPRALIGKSADTDDNMQPAHYRCHQIKTRADQHDIAKAKRREARHMGFKKSKSPLPFGRGSKLKKKMDGRIVTRAEDERKSTNV